MSKKISISLSEATALAEEAQMLARVGSGSMKVLKTLNDTGERLDAALKIIVAQRNEIRALKSQPKAPEELPKAPEELSSFEVIPVRLRQLVLAVFR